MMLRFARIGLLAPLLAGLPASASPAGVDGPPRYTITEIGPLPGYEEAQAFGINDRGDVVGFSFTNLIAPDCCYIRGSAFLFRDGELIDLGSLNGLDTRAEAINNLGQVAGWADEAFPRAFLWENGEIQDIGTLGGPYSKASAINDSGQIVGWSYPPDTTQRQAFLWQNGTMLDLGPASPNNQWEFGINELGEVVGPGFIWQDGVRTTVSMRGYDINDQGQVVGLGVGGAISWENGTFQQLGGTVAYAINNAGHIVGVATSQGVLWKDGVMYRLGDLTTVPSDWLIRSGWDINDAGQIVGSARTPDGITHAFIMTPAPPPIPTLSEWCVIVMAFLLVGAGTVIAAIRRRVRTGSAATCNFPGGV